MNIPRKMKSGSAMAREWNRMVDALRSMRPSQGSGTLLTHTPHGTIHNSGFRRSSAGSPSVSATRMRIKSIGQNSYTCRTWDGTTEGSSDITVAKPPEMRGISSETLDSVSISYDYDGDTTYTTRTASWSGGSEDQGIVPRFASSNTEIWATQPDGGTGVSSVTWIDINVAARAWAAMPEEV